MSVPPTLQGLDEVEIYPLANLLGTKLRKCLSEHQRNGTASFVFGACDAVMANEYVEGGADTLFVSGATSSLMGSGPNDDCGADLSDYTYDTVPSRVRSIVQNQIQWARIDKARGEGAHDRLLPVIADADSGHGSATATMKMVRLFLQAGCAGFHVDDLVQGEKMFEAGTSHAHTLVPWSESVRRLRAARLQLDISKATAVLIGRTDASTCTRITSTIDPVDRPFILGVTNAECPSLLAALGAFLTGALALEKEKQWESLARLKSLDEAVSESLTAEKYQEWANESAGMNVSDALRMARKKRNDIYWDPEPARNARGWYRFHGGTEAAISRSVLNSAYCDLVFPCMWGVDVGQMERISREILSACPGKWLGLNWSLPPQGMEKEVISQLAIRAGSLGYVWQCAPMVGAIAESSAIRELHRRTQESGVLAISEVIEEAKENGQSVVDWYERAGAYSDEIMRELARPSRRQSE